MTEMWPWITLALLGIYHGINPGMGWLFAVALGLQERKRRAVVRAFAPIALGHAASIAVVVALVAAMQVVVSPLLLRYVGAGALVAFGLYKLLAPMSHPRWVGMRVGFLQLAAWSFLMATAHGAGLMVVPIVLKLPSETPQAVQTIPVVQAGLSENEALSVRIEPVGQKTTSTTAPEPACHDPQADPEKQAGSELSAGKASLAGSDPPAGRPQEAASCHQAMADSKIVGPLAQAAAVLLHTLAMFLAMAVIALVVYEKIGLAILRRAWFNLDLLWAGALIGAGILTVVL